MDKDLKQDLNPQTGFPVFMKLLAIFIVFGFLPLLLIYLIFLWDHNSSIKVVSNLALENPSQIQEKIQELQHQFRIKTGFLFAFFLIAMLGGVIFSARTLVNPLSSLLSGIRLLIKGNYGAEIKVGSNDEYEMFADYFNKMSHQLKTMIEREKKISQMKSEFITLAAHQLRTPLSAIKWTMKMLIDGDIGTLNQEQKEVLENSYQASENVINLTKDLLDVVKIEEGKFDYNFNYYDLVEVVEKAVEEQKIMAEKKNIRLDLKRPEKSLPKIKLDAQKIKLALSNILTNAVNYTLPDGFVSISINLHDNDFIEIKVEDSGIGIPKSQMARLFTRFSRGENAMRMQTEGSGLGLFIARNIIKSHGGEIQIESEENKGTTVYLILPLLERLIPEKPQAFEEFIMGA